MAKRKSKEKLMFWNERTNEHKEIDIDDDEAYDALLEQGFVLEYFPDSDLAEC